MWVCLEKFVWFLFFFSFSPQWSQFAKHCIIFKKCSRLFFGLPKVCSHCCFLLQPLRLFYEASPTPKVVCFWLWPWVKVGSDTHELWLSSVLCRQGPENLQRSPCSRGKLFNEALATHCSACSSLWCTELCKCFLAKNWGSSLQGSGRKHRSLGDWLLKRKILKKIIWSQSIKYVAWIPLLFPPCPLQISVSIMSLSVESSIATWPFNMVSQGFCQNANGISIWDGISISRLYYIFTNTWTHREVLSKDEEHWN